MILNKLFLPDYLFAKQVIGIEIGKNTIFACETYQKKSTLKIQKIISVAIDQQPQDSYDDQLTSALQQVINQVHGDEIRLTIPNSHIFFKELTVPFLDSQKIRLVLGYEIEPLLPFPLHEAVFDFIITSQNSTKKESTLLVAITKKSQLDFYLNLFAQVKSKIRLGTLTIDLLGSYSLFSRCYAKTKDQYQILLELGKTSITITGLENGQIRQVRNLPYGISTIISKIANTTKKTQKEVVETLLRFGLNEHANSELVAPFIKLVNDLEFTCNSFRSQPSTEKALHKILVIENAIEIKDFTKFLASKLDLQFELFSSAQILNQKDFLVAPGMQINSANLASFSATVTIPKTADFNLATQQVGQSQQLLRYQILTAISLTIILFASIYTISLFRAKAVSSTLDVYKKQAMSTLKKNFDNLSTNDLGSAINQTLNTVSNEKKLWFSFSNQTRYGYLKYLQSLTEAFEIYKVHPDLKKLVITDGVMTIQGSVEEHNDVFLIEQALRSVPIFTSFTKSQDKNFTIKISLKSSNEELK